ncbi:MAG: PASTA domain-containing protein [Eubacteriales bacterium]
MNERRSYLDTMTETSKPESYSQEKFVAVKNGRKKTKIMIAAAVAAVLLAGGYFIYTTLDSVKIPALVGMTLTDATDWASKNKITLSAQSVYDFNTDDGIILTQEIASGKTIRKNSTITIQVSQGANPDEAISFPDISSMTTSQIEAWISDNKLTGVKIATANSDVVAVDKVISYTMTDDTEANFKRKSRVTVNVSLGPKAATETVVMTDFSSMKAGEVLQWGSDNGVDITLQEAYDNYIESGNVISQSVLANTEINKTDPLTVVISIGKPITVLDFSAMTQDEATAWAKSNNITLTIIEKYSSSNDKGKLYAQSVSAGTSMKAGDELKLTYSLGRVDIASFIGQSKLEITTWQNTANTKSADIHLKFTTDYGEKGSSGKIISQSIKNDFVDPGTTITVTVSLGMKLLAPDFSGITQAQCSALGQSEGVTVLFNYQNSTTVGYGYVISQSPASNTVLTDADHITVVISSSGSATNKVTVPDFGTMSRSGADSWAKTNNITLTYKDQYSDSVSIGNLFAQSAAAGSSIDPGTGITISSSLGKVQVASFLGKTKLDALNWEADANTKGANINLAFSSSYGDAGSSGKIIGQSIQNDYAAVGSTISFVISLGKQIVVPDFLSPLQNEAGCTAVSSSLGMKIVFNYQNSVAAAKGYVISQSTAAGSIISDADTVTIVISLGPV